MNYHLERLRRLLMELINELIRRVKDPEVFPPDKEGSEFITVTDVELSSDGSLAKCYVSALTSSPERQKAIVGGLNRAHGFLRHELGRELRLKTIPNLVFFKDDTQDKAEHMYKLLEGLHIDNNSNDA
ncbi:MAG: 30S ribosome-binding factor RbfA [bacterium]|nr:30S ribosome-binding factor RbfA [bacterium]